MASLIRQELTHYRSSFSKPSRTSPDSIGKQSSRTQTRKPRSIAVCGGCKSISYMLFIYTLTGMCIADWRKAAWLVDRETVFVCCCFWLWRGDGDFPLLPPLSPSLSVAVADVASELWSNRAFIPLSHQLEGFSSRVPQINRPPPSSHLVQRLLLLNCGALLTPTGQKGCTTMEVHRSTSVFGRHSGFKDNFLNGVKLAWPFGRPTNHSTHLLKLCLIIKLYLERILIQLPF